MIDCGTLHVPVSVMQHVADVESSFNPYAIGVVRGQLNRQPKNLAEAVATAKMLEKAGYNFSLGIVQVNRYNLKKYGLNTYEKAFDVCSNLQAGSKILKECYISARHDWGKAFSCYYSGNFTTGFRHGYVQKIFQSMRNSGNVSYVKLNNATKNQAAAFQVASIQRSRASRYGQSENLVGPANPTAALTATSQKEDASGSGASSEQKNHSGEAVVRRAAGSKKDTAFVF